MMKMTTSLLFLLVLFQTSTVVSFSIISSSLSSSSSSCCSLRPKSHYYQSSPLYLSEWSNFSALDDDDDDYDNNTDTNDNDNFDGPPGKRIGYADENDSQEYKAQIGSTIPSPELSYHGEGIFLPQGSVLPLTEENVQGVLQACREEIGTMFGYSAENRGVGITGGVDFVDFDGPSVIVTLKGRFWHQRTTVLERVEKYIQGRIPEVVEVIVEDPWELTDEANDAAY